MRLSPIRPILPALLLLAASALPAQAPPAGALEIRAVAARPSVRPGDQVVIAVVLEHREGFHTWPNQPVVPLEFAGVVPIATTVSVGALPAGAELRRLQWPTPDTVTVYYTGSAVPLLAYVGRTIVYVPIQLGAGTPTGRVRIAVSVRTQTCDDRICYFPQTVERSAEFTVVPTGQEVAATVNQPELFRNFGLVGFAATGTLPAPPVAMNVFGWSFSFDPNGAAGLSLLLFLAALGGLALNFTPCVLPLIPIKVLGLSQAAQAPARVRLLGLAMAAGVVAFWLALGGAIAFVAGFTAINSLFQTAWFAPLVGIIVAVMALGMFRGMSIWLPQGIYRYAPRQDTVGGSLAFGVMTAVLSTPCTAPFMAGAAAWAAAQAPATTLVTFSAIGAGMALPYLLLTFYPGLIRRLPKAGPASVVVKEVIGLLMLAVAAFFIGSAASAWFQTPPDPASRAYWWAVAGFLAAAAGWMGWQSWRLAQRPSRRWTGSLIGALGIVAALGLGRSLSSPGPIAWVYYTPERFAAAVAEEKVIVLDFTAEWCLNCKALEAAVLHRGEIVALLASPGVVPIRVDLTSDNPAGSAKLQELEWVGIPLLAVYGPATGYGSPQQFDSYTVQMVRDAVAAARQR
jgi:thiol:disulfide interchange protein